MIQATGKVISNRKIKPDYYIMSVKCPSVAKKAKPGQFLTIRCGNSAMPLLRRPFGFHRINTAGFEILYEIKGKGTLFLSGLKPGDEIDILGPLGNGFTMPKGRKDFMIVAGGIGVAPLASLAESLARIKGAKICAVIGARSEKNLLCAGHFRKLGIKTTVATDDGSLGHKGPATDLLKNFLPAARCPMPAVYACGPRPMLKALSGIAEKYGLECYASLEENIACGVGACLGCAVKTKSGYRLVCKDGPVFNIKEIIW